MTRHIALLAAGVLFAASGRVSAQSPAGSAVLPTVEQQIAASVQALPKDLQDGATVMGYRSANKLETIRSGKNGMTCLALFVVEPNFHVACYHNGMEPFMSRGR